MDGHFTTCTFPNSSVKQGAARSFGEAVAGILGVTMFFIRRA